MPAAQGQRTHSARTKNYISIIEQDIYGEENITTRKTKKYYYYYLDIEQKDNEREKIVDMRNFLSYISPTKSMWVLPSSGQTFCVASFQNVTEINYWDPKVLLWNQKYCLRLITPLKPVGSQVGLIETSATLLFLWGLMNTHKNSSVPKGLMGSQRDLLYP